MSTHIVPDSALVAAFWLIAGVGLLLVAAVTTVKLGREVRTARAQAYREALRPLVVAVAAGEDEEGRARGQLATIGPRSHDVLVEVVTALLAKVRGEPARHLVDLLEKHGVVAHAVADLGSRSAVRRARAVHLLGITGDPVHLDALVHAVSDRSAEVRVVAAGALGVIRDPRAAGPVLQGVRPVRGHAGLPSSVAIEALMSMGIGIAGALREGLGDPDAGVRHVAVVVAGHGLFGSTLPQLRQLLGADENVLVRSAAATALGRAGLAADLPALVEVTRLGHPAGLRRAAVAAVGELGSPDGTPVLTGILGEADRRLASLAGDALVRLGAPGVAALEAVVAGGAGQARRAARGALDLHHLRTGLEVAAP